jgi:predicted  nucleic acid-binding Zn-ribbon protein
LLLRIIYYNEKNNKNIEIKKFGCKEGSLDIVEGENNGGVFKKEIEKVNEEIDRLKENRTEYAKQLPMPLVKKYVQLIKNKNHKAVVFNSNNACSGCGFHIRPQILIELNDPNKIIYCENCGRILVRTLEA